MPTSVTTPLSAHTPAVQTWNVYAQAPAAALNGTVAIIIDQLRASSTITTALHNGAEAVYPCLEVADVQTLAAHLQQTHPNSPVLTGGERGGLPIEGFTFGNLPREYTPALVRSANIAFTSTNGTRAIQHAAQSSTHTLIGCLFNCSAVAAAAYAFACSAGSHIALLCAGTRGSCTLDDCLAGGAIAAALSELDADLSAGIPPHPLPNGDDSTMLCLELWRSAQCPGGIERILRQSRGGRNLARIGMASEIPALCHVDTLNTVPVFKNGVLCKL